MTIRQQGGVFGRNPKFNDVDATNINADDITVSDDLIVGDKIGVGGVTVPQAPLHLSGAGNLIRLQQDGAYIQWKKTDGTDTGYIEASPSGFNINAQDGKDLRLIQGGAERCRINDNGIAMANGKGIDFSATSGTGTSELFDDYEEGTYTVTLYDADSGGNASATTTTGYYTKVGRQVTVWFSDLNNIDTTGMTSGNPLYVSLPFTSSNTVKSAGSCILDNFNLGSNVQSGLTINPNSARFLFRSSKSAASAAFLTVGAITSGTSDILALSVSYNV